MQHGTFCRIAGQWHYTILNSQGLFVSCRAFLGTCIPISWRHEIGILHHVAEYCVARYFLHPRLYEVAYVRGIYCEHAVIKAW